MSSRNNRLNKPLKTCKANRCELQHSDDDIDISKAKVIPGAVDPEAQPLRCWCNVESKIKRDGGQAISGWQVCDHGGYYRLIAHTIWQAPDGQVWDITPGSQQGDPFVVDPRAGSKCPVAHKVKPGATAWQTMMNYEAMMQSSKYDGRMINNGNWQ